MFNRKHLCDIGNDDDVDKICTRSNSGPLFHINKPSCESYRRNICYSGAIEWNNLNADVRNSENIFTFKKIKKNWLTNTYSQQ